MKMSVTAAHNHPGQADKRVLIVPSDVKDRAATHSVWREAPRPNELGSLNPARVAPLIVASAYKYGTEIQFLKSTVLFSKQVVLKFERNSVGEQVSRRTFWPAVVIGYWKELRFQVGYFVGLWINFHPEDIKKFFSLSPIAVLNKAAGAPANVHFAARRSWKYADFAWIVPGNLVAAKAIEIPSAKIQSGACAADRVGVVSVLILANQWLRVPE